MVLVRSVTKGGLTYISPKTGFEVLWHDLGAEQYMEFGELLTMKASKPRFLNEPFVVVDDEDVAEKLGLLSVYKDMIDVEDLEDFFTMSPSKMEAKLEKAPKGTKKLVADKSRELVQNGQLFDIRKIKIIEKNLMIDLQMLMD